MKYISKLIFGMIIFTLFVYAYDIVLVPTGNSLIRTESSVVIPGCGDDICSVNETCSKDNVSCTDISCYEPTCENGCGLSTITNGNTDEGCYDNVGCVGGSCTCNGLGTCVSTAPPDTGGVTSGGGGSYTPPTTSAQQPDFILDKDVLHVVIKQGELTRDYVTIKNTGNTELEFLVNPQNLNKFLLPSMYIFTLNPGESYKLALDIFSSENELPDIYTGQILVTAGGITRAVNVILEVQQKEALFDIKLIIDGTTQLEQGKDFTTNISIKNMGDLRGIDILLEFNIKDMFGNIIHVQEESIAIEDILEIQRHFILPSGIRPGNYIIYVKLIYGDQVAIGSSLFTVKEKQKEILEKLRLPFIGEVESPGAVVVFFVVSGAAIIIIEKHGKEEKKKHSKWHKILHKLKKRKMK